MFVGGVDSFFWIIFWAGGARKVGAFCGLINISTPVLVHDGYNFISDQQFNACTVMGI